MRVKAELAEFETALKDHEELNDAREAKEKFGEDLKMERVGGGVERVVEEMTWFWQDLLPNVLGQLKEIPIPRYGFSFFRSGPDLMFMIFI